MATTVALERQRAQAVAEEYRSKGYEVIEEPSPAQLPEFLSGYQPDLLVRRGNEMLVVEVKARSSLGKDPRVRELAQLLRGKPGWNFELIIVPEEEKLDLPKNAHPMEWDDILRRVDEAEKLLELGYSEAAILLAWSALESTVRLLIESEDIPLDHFTSLYILNQAVINGVISRSDYKFLMTAMKYQNAITHGFKITDPDPTVVGDLISITKRVLQSNEIGS